MVTKNFLFDVPRKSKAIRAFYGQPACFPCFNESAFHRCKLLLLTAVGIKKPLKELKIR